MRFICILLLLNCWHKHATASETLPDGNNNEFQLTISKYGNPDAEQPMTLRRSMVITVHSIVKKSPCVALLPGTVTILCPIKHMPGTVMPTTGIHVKNYLRHIYPSMHYW